MQSSVYNTDPVRGQKRKPWRVGLVKSKADQEIICHGRLGLFGIHGSLNPKVYFTGTGLDISKWDEVYVSPGDNPMERNY